MIPQLIRDIQKLSQLPSLGLAEIRPDRATHPAQQESLQDVLLDLAKWGRPRLGQYGDDGAWHCSIEVNVTPVGVKFEAKSDWKQMTPLAAALMCRKHLLDAVKAIGGGV